MPGERGAKAPRVNLASLFHGGLLRLEKHTGGFRPPLAGPFFHHFSYSQLLMHFGADRAQVFPA